MLSRYSDYNLSSVVCVFIRMYAIDFDLIREKVCLTELLLYHDSETGIVVPVPGYRAREIGKDQSER